MRGNREREEEDMDMDMDVDVPTTTEAPFERCSFATFMHFWR
jgi:hypothetical protein